MNRTFYRLAIYDLMIQAISWQLTHSTYGASYLLLDTHIALQDFPQFTDAPLGISFLIYRPNKQVDRSERFLSCPSTVSMSGKTLTCLYQSRSKPGFIRAGENNMVRSVIVNSLALQVRSPNLSFKLVHQYITVFGIQVGNPLSTNH